MSKIILTSPPAGQSIRHAVQDGHTYVFSDFDPAEHCDCLINSHNMLMSFGNGSTIELTDIFAPGINTDSVFLEMRDGNIISAQALLESLTSEATITG